ncbi:MAG: hypothetical protein FJY07_05835 [Bacteroidetes bacterium]|nr:hypothetical protein [Bacteroidota bacterium]
MKGNQHHSRRDFFKSFSLAAITVSAFSFLNFKKSRTRSILNIRTLSMKEANRIIMEENFTPAVKVKPAPVPASEESPMG